jgi:hypothetical protein
MLCYHVQANRLLFIAQHMLTILLLVLMLGVGNSEMTFPCFPSTADLCLCWDGFIYMHVSLVHVVHEYKREKTIVYFLLIK